jgi:pilus assembly protein Flp/PilA
MFPALWNLFSRLYALAGQEDGQDIVEYALLMALLIFGATAGMRSLAAILATTYNQLVAILANTIT